MNGKRKSINTGTGGMKDRIQIKMNPDFFALPYHRRCAKEQGTGCTSDRPIGSEQKETWSNLKSAHPTIHASKKTTGSDVTPEDEDSCRVIREESDSGSGVCA